MENAADNESLIRQIVEDWAKAVRDENMNGILAHHADDIIIFDVPEPFQSIGIDAYRKTWDLFFKYTRPYSIFSN
jgi:ketosteroid isomerase-like protein